jgi:translocation and assembly module TamB
MSVLPDSPPTPPSRARPRRRWLWAAAGAGAIALGVIAAAAAAYAWLQTPAALAWAVERIHDQSRGRLAVVGATGSLLSTVQARELRYRDESVELVARDVALEWSPWALWSRTIRIAGLGAQRIVVTTKPTGNKSSLPGSLALPFEIAIDRAAFGEVVVAAGDRQFRIEGVTLGYAGGGGAHRLRQVGLASDWGAIAGEMSISADAPFAVSGAATIAGSERLRNARLSLQLGGRLESLQLKVAGSVLASEIDANATFTPFAEVPLQELSLHGRELDLAAFDATLPRTMLDFAVRATMATDGRVTGSLEATNAAAGPIDRDRLPLDTLATAFALSADAIELTGLVASSGPVARATGDARIPLRDAAARGQWQLELSRLDLARIHSKLAPTRLSGRLRAALSGTEQQLDGDLRQDDLGASFAATVAANVVNVTRLRARAGQGEFNGRARYDFSGVQRFEIAGKALRFDPAQFGAFPQARLDGELRAAGALQPAWHADVAISLDPSSRLREAPLSGRLSGRVTAATLQDATIDLALAGARFKARGSYGPPGARIDATFDIPETASVLVPLADWVPVGARGLRGRLVGKGSIWDAGGERAASIDVSGENLALDALAAGTLKAHAEVARLKADPRINLSVSGMRLATPVGSYASWSGTLSGTASAHRLQAAFTGAGIDADFVAEGGLASSRWSGSLMQFANRGTYPAKLAAPAHLEFAAGQAVVGETRLAVAGGNLRIDGFRWIDGVATGKGGFDAVPLAALAHIAGTELPLRSTLVVGGEWNVTATPRLNGTLTLRREQGDLYARTGGTRDAGEIALGITRADLDVALVDDTAEATFEVDAAQLGTARGKLSLGRDPDAAAGRVGGAAPVRGTLTATLSSLQALWPLIGTAARVDGRVKLDLHAEGKLQQVAIGGTIFGDALRLDAPAYGLHWTDGVLRARIGGGQLALDEFSFQAGDGRFTAAGTVAATTGSSGFAAASASGTDIAWRADKLRVTNRPDLRLIVSGAGRLSVQEGHLLLSGALKADEGRVDFDRASGARLGDDVIVAGREPRPPAAASRFGNVPLGIDVEVDLGRNLAVSGEGLRTDVAGKVRITAVPEGTLSAKGTIRAVNGTYFAFGQRLTIRRGQLIFDGPIDDPALDIVALRPNLQVEAGVAVSGTVRVPRVQLTSEPPVPDGEKLSWLVLGQGLERSSAADAAALQAAAATLLGSGRTPIGTSVARAVGLDDISIRAAAAESGGTGAQVVAVGKRLSDRLYVVFEQGLSVANNALKVEYALTRSVTLRAEAGLISGVGIYYRRSFE